MKLKLAILFIMFAVLYSCLEPFNATVGDQASKLLVVDGLITNQRMVNTVKLTRSVANIDEEVTPVTGALVIIEDDTGKKTILSETDKGIYQTDTCSFYGATGRTYTLYIKTGEGEEYRSAPCLMPPSSEIDSVYYVPGKDINTETDRTYNGVGIYVSGNAGADETEYLRWAFKEDWRFSVPYYPDEIPTPDGGWEPYESNRFCWKSETSGEVMLYSFPDQSGRDIEGKNLYFINVQLSDKLSDRYSTLVEQYSISEEEYSFWKKLKQSNEGAGSIFGEQPFSITGNIKNINNPDENVLGYFQVTGYTSKRIYINRRDLYDYRLPFIRTFNCSVDTFLLKELNEEAIEIGTPIFRNMYDIYNRFVLADGALYELAYPIYANGIEVIGLGLSSEKCTDCSLSGNPKKPDFWEDEY